MLETSRPSDSEVDGATLTNEHYDVATGVHELVDIPKASKSAVLTVARIIDETRDAKSICFSVPDELLPRFGYRPGQFLTLRVPSDLTGSVARCYSIASSPHSEDELKVTVKRTVSGYASNWLCDNLLAGSRIEVLPPGGRFTPADLDADMLLFAGGSGITPVISILKSALVMGSGNIVLVYANTSAETVIFARELRALAAEYADRVTIVHVLESLQGRFEAAQFATVARPYAGYDAYMCGPQPFMTAVQSALRMIGMPADRVHHEVFLSLSGDPFEHVVPSTVTDDEEAASVVVSLDGEEHSMEWPRSQTLVELMLGKGIDVPYSCREGECGSCACTLVEGKVEMEGAAALGSEDIAAGYILGCRAKPKTDNLRIEF